MRRGRIRSGNFDAFQPVLAAQNDGGLRIRHCARTSLAAAGMLAAATLAACYLLCHSGSRSYHALGIGVE